MEMQDINKQYIGARYVPKFYVNSQDPASAEWEENVTYEPLTIVMDGQDAYTSKQLVPDSVGEPSENPLYWVKTGNYNAAMAALQENFQELSSHVDGFERDITEDFNEYKNTVDGEISDFKNEIRTAVSVIPTSRKFILIGDSFGYGVQGGSLPNVTGWIEYANNRIPNVFFYNSGVDPAQNPGSTDFSSGGFLNILNYIKDNKLGTTLPQEITDIVVLGGNNNDETNSYQTIYNAIAAFISSARTSFPNARIAIGCFGLNAYHMTKVGDTFRAYRQSAINHGAEFIFDTLMLAASNAWDSGYGHITETGYNNVNPYILEAIMNGHCEYCFSDDIALTVNTTDVEETTDSPLTWKLSITRTNRTLKFSIMNTNMYTGYILRNKKVYTSGGIGVTAFTRTSGGRILVPYTSGAPFDFGRVMLYDDTHGLYYPASAIKVGANVLDAAQTFNIFYNTEAPYSGQPWNDYDINFAVEGTFPRWIDALAYTG